MGANEFERRRWNDERWAALWPRRERLTDKVTAYLLAAVALRPGDRVLEGTPHEIEVEAPEDSIVDEAQLAFMGVPEEKLSAAKVAVHEHMQRFRIDAQLSRFPLAFQIFQASKQ